MHVSECRSVYALETCNYGAVSKLTSGPQQGQQPEPGIIEQ